MQGSKIKIRSDLSRAKAGGCLAPKFLLTSTPEIILSNRPRRLGNASREERKREDRKVVDYLCIGQGDGKSAGDVRNLRKPGKCACRSGRDPKEERNECLLPST